MPASLLADCRRQYMDSLASELEIRHASPTNDMGASLQDCGVATPIWSLVLGEHDASDAKWASTLNSALRQLVLQTGQRFIKAKALAVV